MPHVETNACVDKAEALLATGDVDSFHYASLQLRMGIEYLFYELIPLYRKELPDNILTAHWQPQRIFAAILECNPDADKDARYAFGPVGNDVSESGWTAFESKAPTKKILSDHYHRLGNFLHVPVDMVNRNLDKWRDDLIATVSTLRECKLGQVLCNISAKVEIPCECGRTIYKNKCAVETSGFMRCPDPKCGAIYDVRLENGDTVWSQRKESYTCPYCNTLNYVSIVAIRDGMKITCVDCGKRVVVKAAFRLELSDGEPEFLSVQSGAGI